MNEKVINAISSLEQEALKTLMDGPLEPMHIVSILGTEVISKRPDGKSTGIANPIITSILCLNRGFSRILRTFGSPKGFQEYMKRFFIFFLTLTIYPVLTATGYGETLVHVVLPQTTPIAVGERLNVDIQIADAQGVVGYELTVGFDPTVLRYIGGGNADYLPEGAFTLSPIVLNDAVYIAATSIIGAASDSKGKLATLTFEVVAARASTLQLRDVILSDSAGMSLSVATRDGHIETVESPLIGDVNGDKKVNILDLTLVASNFGVRSPATPRADVNADGTINILDMVLIAQHLDVVSWDTQETEVNVIPVRTPDTPAVAAKPPIDFEAEKVAIQEVYSAFYTAFNDNDLKAIGETFRTNDGKVAFGTIFAGNEPVPIAFGWRNVEIAIEGLWIGIGTKGSKWGRDDVLKDFWIRYKGSKIEASAIGYNCYKGSFPGETHLYLVKEEKDGWKIHELDSSTENNLGIFGFHKGKPRLKEAGRFFTTDADKVP